MRILFVADGRSPIALNWMRYFIDEGYEVHLASMFTTRLDLELASLTVLPLLSGGSGGEKGGGKANHLIRNYSTPHMRTRLRHWLIPWRLPNAARVLRSLIESVQPSIVHAMRVPFEGILAALANGDQPITPLVISIWGNDFTLHAPSNFMMRRYTKLALNNAYALHTDCYRDLRLATDWGFDGSKTTLVAPGAGGVQLDVFYPSPQSISNRPSNIMRVINPRGLRAYVNNETFFRAVALVLGINPNTRFLCPAMAGRSQAERWSRENNVTRAVELMPEQTRTQMADLFRQTEILVSPSTHDGTPNTLLESMACGSFPVVGDLESLREWITPGVNGLLVDPNDPQALADAILLALNNPKLRQRARKDNLRLITKRGAYQRVMNRAEGFYTKLVAEFRNKV